MLAVVYFLLGLALATPQQQYDEGIQFLTAQQYEKAAVSFHQALRDGGVDSRVYHGLGNALFEQEKKGQAIVAWRRGLLLDPTNEDLQYNLDFAEQEIPQDGKNVHLSPLVWVILGSLLGCAAVVLPFFWGVRKMWGWAVLLLAGMAFSGWAWFQYQVEFQKGVVFASSVVAKSAPNGGGIDLFSLSIGEEVEIIEQQENGLFIENRDKERGWVSTLSVMSLDPTAEFSIQ